LVDDGERCREEHNHSSDHAVEFRHVFLPSSTDRLSDVVKIEPNPVPLSDGRHGKQSRWTGLPGAAYALILQPQTPG
jgi:hypothetical protein